MWSHLGVITVGIRELKARLSAYLRRVRKGEVVRVTDRGTVIAELRSAPVRPEVPAELEGLARLAARGVVRLGKSNVGVEYPVLSRLVPDGTAKALLDAEREDVSF